MARNPLLLALLVVLAALVPFLPALGGDWVLDDFPLIAHNPNNQSFDSWRVWFTQGMWDMDIEASVLQSHLGFYRPLVLASYAVDWTRGGGSTVAFHVTNQLAHCAVALLAFLAARRWTGSWLLACLVALLFAVHPGKVENVSWISGRTDVFASLGILLACWGIAERSRGRRRGIVLEVLGSLIAYLSKETAIVLSVMAVFEVWHASPQRSLDLRGARELLRRARLWLPQALLAAAYLGARLFFIPLRRQVKGLTFVDRAEYFFETVGRVAELLVWPRDLSMHAGLIQRSPEGLLHSFPYEVAGVAVLLGSAGACLFLWRRAPEVVVSLLALFGTLAPVLNIVFSGEVVLATPRFLYLPSIFAALAVVQLLSRKAGLLVLPVVGSAVFMAMGWQRSTDFSDNEHYLEREFSYHPESPLLMEWAIRRDLRIGESDLALRRAVCAHQLAQARFNHDPAGGRFILSAVKVAAQDLRDLPPERLAAMAAFLEEATAGQRRAFLTDPLVLEVAPGSKASQAFQASSRALLLAAHLRARAGQSTQARRDIDAALSRCSGCVDIESAAAELTPLLVDVPPARTLDEARVHFARLSQLRLWGRALGSIAPFLNEAVKQGPEAVEVISRAALMAGDEPLGHELLSRLPHERATVIRRETARPPQQYSEAQMGPFLPGTCALPHEIW